MQTFERYKVPMIEIRRASLEWLFLFLVIGGLLSALLWGAEGVLLRGLRGAGVSHLHPCRHTAFRGDGLSGPHRKPVTSDRSPAAWPEIAAPIW